MVLMLSRLLFSRVYKLPAKGSMRGSWGMIRLFRRFPDSCSLSHIDAISVLGVLIIPAELPLPLFDLSTIASCWRLLRRIHKRTPMAPRMATNPSTPTAIPTAVPVGIPLFSFSGTPWASAESVGSVPWLAVGATVIVCT